MANRFGEALKTARCEKDLTLREFAKRASMHAGNLSKLERGRIDPPQDPAILERMINALGYPAADSRAQEIKDLAAIENGRIPPDLLEDEEVILHMPILLRTLMKLTLTAAQIDDLVEMIARGSVWYLPRSITTTRAYFRFEISCPSKNGYR